MAITEVAGGAVGGPWGAIAAGAGMGLLGGLFGGDSAPSYQMDPRLVEEQIAEGQQMRELRTAAQREAIKVRGITDPYMRQGLARNERVQAMAEDQATQAYGDYQTRGRPLMERMYAENVFTPEQEQAQQREASGRAMAEVQGAANQQQQIAARRAAAYGYRPDTGGINSAAMGAAKAGAGNAARQQKSAEQKQGKAAMYDIYSGRESASRSGLGQTSAMGGQGSSMGGNMMNTGQGGFSSAAAFNPQASMNQRQQAGQFGANQAMTAWQNRGDPFGDMAQLGTQFGMMYGRNGGFGGSGGGGSSYGGWSSNSYDGSSGFNWADGGRLDYADGGEIEVMPGVFGTVVGYADGGMPAIERHDGMMTGGDGSGGKLQGPGTGISDDIEAETDAGEPLRVANGEYIIPTDVVEILGEEFFDNLIAKLHVPAAIQRQQGAA